MKIKKIHILSFLLMITAEFVVAQNSGNYFPLHVGDYLILHADSSSGEYQPTTYRSDVQGIDLINGKAYFRIRDQMRRDDGSHEWTIYNWIYVDSTGSVLGAIGESPEIIMDIPIPTKTITVDGDTADWVGVDTLVTDPQGDDSPNTTGADIKALFVAKDANNLYLRMDLWEDANTNFQNGPSPNDGRYTFRLDNDGPYDRMHLTIAYDDSSFLWSLEDPGPNDPPGLGGPNYVGVSGSVIELRVPLDLIGNPSNYSTIGGSAEYYDPGEDRSISWDEALVTETNIFDPPVTWMSEGDGALNIGDTWEFDSYEMGGHFSMSVESVSETVQVPAGTFPRCVKIKMVVTDTNGDTTQLNVTYYAEDVGQVVNIMSSEYMGEWMRFELVDYSIQGSNVFVYTEPAIPTVGNNLSIFGTVPQHFSPTTRELYYRMGGQTTFQTANLIQNGNVYEASLPANLVTIRGIEYYVRFADGQTEVTLPGISPEDNPKSIRVKVNQYEPPITLEKMIYKMISIPLELTDPSISAVLFDDYGEYHKPTWRLCSYQENDTSYYVEYPNIEKTFTPSTAFWLITRSGNPFDVENGWSMESHQPYTVTLDTGWNQVGHPFAFPVTVDSINATGNWERPVYYNGEDYEYNVSVVEPWEGYFINNRETFSIVLSIPPMEAEGGSRKAVSRLNIKTETEYILQLSAKMLGFELIDTQNYIGLLEEAKDGTDHLDFSEAPPIIGDHLQLSIVEDEERFAGNFKPLHKVGHNWKLELSSTIPGEREVQIHLVEIGQLPDSLDLYILDKDYHRVLPAEDGKLRVQLKDRFPVRHLQIIIGTKDFAEKESGSISLIPYSYALMQNVPNPFNPETTIHYQLSKRTHVILEIFNIMGQKIRTLMNKAQDAGEHSVIWNSLNDEGQSVAGGFYLYRMRTEEFTATKKLILIR